MLFLATCKPVTHYTHFSLIHIPADSAHNKATIKQFYHTPFKVYMIITLFFIPQSLLMWVCGQTHRQTALKQDLKKKKTLSVIFELARSVRLREYLPVSSL